MKSVTYEPRTTTEIAWLAGLLEGEGWFALRPCGHAKGRKRGNVTPFIAMETTDKDVAERALEIMTRGRPNAVGCRERISSERAYGKKPLYTAYVSGKRAMGWMLTLFPLLGERRRKKITEIARGWREYQDRVKNARGRDERGRWVWNTSSQLVEVR